MRTKEEVLSEFVDCVESIKSIGQLRSRGDQVQFMQRLRGIAGEAKELLSGDKDSEHIQEVVKTDEPAVEDEKKKSDEYTQEVVPADGGYTTEGQHTDDAESGQTANSI